MRNPKSAITCGGRRSKPSGVRERTEITRQKVRLTSNHAAKNPINRARNCIENFSWRSNLTGDGRAIAGGGLVEQRRKPRGAKLCQTKKIGQKAVGGRSAAQILLKKSAKGRGGQSSAKIFNKSRPRTGGGCPRMGLCRPKTGL